MSFEITKETITKKNNLFTVELNVKYNENDYIVHAQEDVSNHSWEQWGAPVDVLKKTTSRIQEIFKDKALGGAKGVLRGIY